MDQKTQSFAEEVKGLEGPLGTVEEVAVVAVVVEVESLVWGVLVLD